MSTPEPCKTCRFHDICYGDGIFRNEDPDPEWKSSVGPTSTVHTCRTCGLKKLTRWSNDDEEPGGEIPDTCPRWDDLHGSALECDACRAERDEIRKSHPLNEQRREALKAVFTNMFDKGKLGDGVEEFCQIMSPGQVIKMGDDYKPALSILSFLQADIAQRFNDPLSKYEAWQRDYFKFEWLEYIFLSLHRNPGDPGRVAFEIVLLVSDAGLVSRCWSQLSPKERIRVRAFWESKVRRVMRVPKEVKA